jgi:hypothetical protein
VRDALWAFRHYDKPEAVPPSEFARRLRAQAQEHPDKLLACLAAMNGPQGKPDVGPQEHDRRNQETQSYQPTRPEPAVTQPTAPRIVKVSVPAQQVITYLLGHGEPSWFSSLPRNFQVLGLETDLRRRRLVLTISSPELVPQPDGQPLRVLELA